MGRMKEIYESFQSYYIEGYATIVMPNGETLVVKMNSFHIPCDKLTAGLIKQSINSAGFLCTQIISAKLDVYRVYSRFPYVFSRSLDLNEEQCKEAYMLPLHSS